MADLVYGVIGSLDGYVADEHGDFDWSAPDAEVLDYVNELAAGTGTEIYGRRLYDTMKVWETFDGDTAEEAEWARAWRARAKVVVSSTLDAVETSRTTLLPSLDAPTLQRLKDEATEPLAIGGPTLAATAIRAGLVDEYYFITCPILVGGGLRALPDGVRLELSLVEERRFGNGVVATRYRAR